MRDMGAAAFDEIKAETPVAGAYLHRYVDCVAGAILEVLPEGEGQGWEVKVFDEDEPNAFALPGRKIGVHKGLLDVTETQDQLAAVIGHEIGHVLAQHGNERMSSQFVVGIGLATAQAMMRSPESREGRQMRALLGLGAQVGILLPYSRSHESEADRIGLELMAQAGFEPEASVELWRNMSRVGGGAAAGAPVHASRARDPDPGVAGAGPGGDEALPGGEGGRSGTGLRRVRGLGLSSSERRLRTGRAVRQWCRPGCGGITSRPAHRIDSEAPAVPSPYRFRGRSGP